MEERMFFIGLRRDHHLLRNHGTRWSMVKWWHTGQVDNGGTTGTGGVSSMARRYPCYAASGRIATDGQDLTLASDWQAGGSRSSLVVAPYWGWDWPRHPHALSRTPSWQNFAAPVLRSSTSIRYAQPERPMAKDAARGLHQVGVECVSGQMH